MKINRLHFFAFSKCYDLITVGPYANRVAKTIANLSSGEISILTVQEQNKIVEPSLIPFGNPTLEVRQLNSKFSDVEMGVGVQDINPSQSSILLKNGAKYFYKNLIYSGNTSDWKQYQKLSTKKNEFSSNYPFSFMHDDLNYNEIQQLFAKRGGHVIVTVPKNIHFGCQNYFMMLLQHKLNQRRQKAPFQTDPVKITVINEGQNLAQFNQPLNKLIEEYLGQYNISHLKNAKYKINYKKRQIQLLSNHIKKTVQFSSIFNYLPLQTPKILQKSKINPFQINRHTLSHTHYQNIYILGNVVNNVYSFGAVQQMSKVIAQNVLYSHMKEKKKALYQGQSKINLWINQNQCHYIETDYDGSRLRKDLGDTKLQRIIYARFLKNTLENKMEKLINSGCKKYSFFDQPTTISTQRYQAPALIDHNMSIL